MTVILHHKDLAPNGATIGKEKAVQLLSEGWEKKECIEEKIGKDEEDFICDVCSKSFKMKMHLENHKRSHK